MNESKKIKIICCPFCNESLLKISDSVCQCSSCKVVIDKEQTTVIDRTTFKAKAKKHWLEFREEMSEHPQLIMMIPITIIASAMLLLLALSGVKLFLKALFDVIFIW